MLNLKKLLGVLILASTVSAIVALEAGNPLDDIEAEKVVRRAQMDARRDITSGKPKIIRLNIGRRAPMSPDVDSKTGLMIERVYPDSIVETRQAALGYMSAYNDEMQRAFDRGELSEHSWKPCFIGLQTLQDWKKSSTLVELTDQKIVVAGRYEIQRFQDRKKSEIVVTCSDLLRHSRSLTRFSGSTDHLLVHTGQPVVVAINGLVATSYLLTHAVILQIHRLEKK